ncbi:MAG: hypothetical protein HFE30_01585 [Clostridiales bacterium]|nr:hypothetical protein [Clostridiales bacterium]
MIQYIEFTPIELLGFSKNNLIELIETNPDIPKEYQDKLNEAINWINEIQEYLYKN